ncbi:MAG: hypothetical protein ABI891_15695 [Acidobacteriota bacterium]
MISKLIVIFFIILCLLVGIFLMILPWFSYGGMGDWGDNYFLNFVVRQTGLPFIRQAVASGWFRGAVTGLGILNLFLAFWEMAHFKQSVGMLEDESRIKK